MRPHREKLELDRNAPEISREWAMGALRSDEATKLEERDYKGDREGIPHIHPIP